MIEPIRRVVLRHRGHIVTRVDTPAGTFWEVDGPNTHGDTARFYRTRGRYHESGVAPELGSSSLLGLVNWLIDFDDAEAPASTDNDELGRIDAELEAERRVRAAGDALSDAVNNENAAAWVLAEALDAAVFAEGSRVVLDERTTAALVAYRRRRTEANAKRAAMRRLRGKR